MPILTVNLSAVQLKTTSTLTNYSTTEYFTVPEHTVMNSVTVEYALLVNSGSNTEDRILLIDGVKAHSAEDNGHAWITSGSILDKTKFTAGSHAFRMNLKSDTSALNRYETGSIRILINYTNTTPPVSIGTMSVDKMSMDAGQTVKISLTKPDAGIAQDVNIYWNYDDPLVIPFISGNTVAMNRDYTLPLARLDKMKTSAKGKILIYMVAYKPGGIVQGDQYIYVDITTPADVKPTLDTFTATRVANVPEDITGYVQGYSGCELAMTATEAYESPLVYNISGHELNVNDDEFTISKFDLPGDYIFTAKVTDGRGKTATKTVDVTILSYTPPDHTSPISFRSDVNGEKLGSGTYISIQSGKKFSALGDENTCSLMYRYYQKGGTPPSYANLTPDTQTVVGGGAVDITKTYIVDIRVKDLLNEKTITFTIPTDLVAFHSSDRIMGIGLGKYSENDGRTELAFPPYYNGNPIALLAYPVGRILLSLEDDDPGDYIGGTWALIAEGKFLMSQGSTYAAASTGGAAAHSHTLAAGFAKIIVNATTIVNKYITKTFTPNYKAIVSGGEATTTSQDYATELGGTTDNGSSLPPYLAVYMWKRTA